jgi:hypothetical protein
MATKNLFSVDAPPWEFDVKTLAIATDALSGEYDGTAYEKTSERNHDHDDWPKQNKHRRRGHDAHRSLGKRSLGKSG